MTQSLAGEIERHLPPNLPDRLGIAVSGGSDSVALLHLLAGICATRAISLCAVTVDHGLRPEAAAEVEMVAALCKTLGLPHDRLAWTGWDGRGNLPDAARTARYRLMADWARERELSCLALGHTQDDQAETVLMRIARGSGVDGLSAMAPQRVRHGVTWLRPMLGLRRSALQDYLRAQGIAWASDPSNDDTRFERIRTRQTLEVLEPLGIDVPGLAAVAQKMAAARDALDRQTFLDARRIARVDAGAVVLDWRAFRTLPDEIARRLVAQALRWISRAPYPPRHAALGGLIEALKAGSGSTAQGCHARRIGDAVWIFREYNAVRDTESPPQELWDGRWRIAGPLTGDPVVVRALGAEGLAQCPGWRDTGRPHPVLLGTPAVWSGDRVVAAPLAGSGARWKARLDADEDAFFAALLSH